MRTRFKTVIFISSGIENGKEKWKCVSRIYKSVLADIAWNSNIHCYYFKPEDSTLYSIDAVAAIHKFMKQLTGKRKTAVNSG